MVCFMVLAKKSQAVGSSRKKVFIIRFFTGSILSFGFPQKPTAGITGF